ncbi:MAG TPA: hypothetical protein PLM55_03595, partial [Chitinophagales bacterium]|nr:hypothetical protein [Chitinophagales bacterium]
MIKAIAQIIICAIAFYQQAIAQIIVANKDLEGIPCIAYGGGSVDSMDTSSYCSISSFYLCEGYVGLYSSGLDNDDIYPDFPKQGNTYVSLLGFHKTTWWGSISVQLSCYIRVGVKYSMTLWAANQFYEGGKVAKKTLVIWGNSDSCSRVEKLWESGQIDTGWHQYTAILTPKLQDYEYIHFRIGLSDVESGFLSLDALSDIYPFNANDVTATIQDTAFAKANSTCIELSATANITTYDTVYWQD